ncbi:MAG: type I-E CRISPR-associated protein Cse2/CasB [Pseudoclavibacter sp.]
MTDTHTERPPQPELRAFPKYIDKRITALVFGDHDLLSGPGYLRNGSQATATLARLRHNVGKPIGADPSILTWTIADLPQRRPADGEQPTDRELAAHTALTLFALHQQSNHDTSAHRLSTSFARACALLRAGSANAKGIERRFAAIQTSTDWDETVRHARGLIQLLKSGRQPLDYAHFAEDLVTLRDPDRATGVRLRWGRDFVRTIAPQTPPSAA